MRANIRITKEIGVHSFTFFYPKGYANKAILKRCDLNLQSNHIGMNTQDIIYPIGKFVSWTFKNVLEPSMYVELIFNFLSNPFLTPSKHGVK